MTTVTRTRKALGTLIREALESRGIEVVIEHVDGAMRYRYEGALLSPGAIADLLGIKSDGVNYYSNGR